MVHRRLTWWIERYQILPQFQFGFRKRKSCLNNLSILTSTIYSGFLANAFTVVIFLDIKGAFDNVNSGILCSILRDPGLPWNLCKFIYNLTSNRSVFFKIFGSTLGPFCSFLGLPQGCILSPLLYTIYTLLIRKYIHANCNYLCFADDIALHVTSSNLQECLDIIESSVCDLSTYLLSLGQLPRKKLNW